MATYLKSTTGAVKDRSRLTGVAETVAQVIEDVRERGDQAVREYSEKFDNWSPQSFRLDAERSTGSWPLCPAGDRRHPYRAGPGARLRPAPAGFAAGLRGRDRARRVPRAEEHAGLRGRRLRAGRPVPARRVGAHDDRDRQGRRGRRGSPRAPRRSAARSPPPPSPRCTWPAPTRSTCSAASRRSPRWRSAPRRSAGSTCSPARATRTWPRPSASSSARSASTCSPGRPRSWSSPTSTPTRSSSPSTCSARPSTAPTRPRSSSPPARRSARRGHRSTSTTILVDMPTARLRRAGLARPRRGRRRRRPRRGLRARRPVRLRARPGPHRRPARGAGEDARLRRAVPRRGHLRVLRRQGHRHQPRAADPRRRPLHRRPLGRQVPQDGHLPGGHRHAGRAPSWASCAAAPRGSSCSRATPAPATSAPPSTPATRFPGRRRPDESAL